MEVHYNINIRKFTPIYLREKEVLWVFQPYSRKNLSKKTSMYTAEQNTTGIAYTLAMEKIG